MFSIEKNSSDNPSPQQNTSTDTGVSVRLQVRDSESSTALPLYWVHCSREARCGVMRGGVISGLIISNNNPCWEDKVGSFVTFSPKYCFCLCSVLNPSTSNPATLRDYFCHVESRDTSQQRFLKPPMDIIFADKRPNLPILHQLTEFKRPISIAYSFLLDS